MQESWTLTVRGVRGSAPCPARDRMEYGGNTVCLTLEQGAQTVVLDAGTGLASLQLSEKTERLDILLSHGHLDHIGGLVLCAPLFDAGRTVHLYGSAETLQAVRTLAAPPFWPLRLAEHPARAVLHTVRPGDCFAAGGFTVCTMAGNHPGGSLLYRLESAGKRLTWALDCEAAGPVVPALTEFARGSDLLVWDASYTARDVRPGWGHSTWKQGARLGRDAGVGRVLMMHYSRAYDDAFLRELEREAAQDAVCLFAKEGAVMTL